MDSRERAARLELVEFQLAELTKAALEAGRRRGARRAAAGPPQRGHHPAAVRRGLRRAVRLGSIGADRARRTSGSGSASWPRSIRGSRRTSSSATASRPQLEDLAFTLRDFGDSIDASPGRLQEVEDRLALLERLKRKHGPTLDEVIARRDALAAEHAALTGGGRQRRGRWTRRSADASAPFPASRRGRSRTGAAGGGQVRDGARARAGRPGDGADALRGAARRPTSTRAAGRSGASTAGEFYLSPNPGEDLRPLARIVSGGELSRVMLALKTLAPADQPGKTLIFDEVDAGIGGRVASVVGREAARRWASGSRCCASPTCRRSPPPGRRTSPSRSTCAVRRTRDLGEPAGRGRRGSRRSRG